VHTLGRFLSDRLQQLLARRAESRAGVSQPVKSEIGAAYSIKSEWVEDEIQKAFAEEKPKQIVLFPIRIDDAVMKTKEPWARKLRDQRNIGDFTRWENHADYKQSFERVLRDLTIPPKEPKAP
jgi:hypothetical protein